MPDKTKETITIFDVAVQPVSAQGTRPLQPRGAMDRMVQASEQAIGVVQRNMTQFIKGVQAILAEGAALNGAFEMDSVEINAQITGEGKIGFAGSGLILEGASGIKIVFKKKSAEEK